MAAALSSVQQSDNAEVQAKVQRKMADWSNLSRDHVLSKFGAELGGLIEEAGYDEMYGIPLKAPVEGWDQPRISSELHSLSLIHI